MDANEFINNCNAHSLEELAHYEEQYVAWSEDGKKILAHAPDEAELYKEIARRGISHYVIGFIPDSNVSTLGGDTFDL